ncbi:Atg14 domain-containing protein [Mycoplasma enhydrae]|uniref:hypothetical protein n=1 Tax=Mycoplasma enhydrae TaxID=2499220 RepID=UPI00197C58BB|nr:hypothetical protein [Mycoplasma enhydrae]MBN4089529.1 hypothetical protein [Mycoplasma enhydrae]MCV3733626.1 Atg14 domain-containing protein [Mycoplasma enhydrae]MCV3753393.1 Atg14 domain-containing protein [Mycoplasma enhydrae]
MKKNLKFLSVLAPIGVIATPLIAISCDNKSAKIKEMKSEIAKIKKNIEALKAVDPIKHGEIEKLITKAEKLTNKNSVKEIEDVIKEIKEEQEKISKSLIEEKDGFSINKFAAGQEKIKASEATKEIKKATDWKGVVAALKKYNIEIKEDKTKLEGWSISLDPGSHEHEHGGEIHLIISISKASEKKHVSFTVKGFEKVPHKKEKVNNWEFRLHGKGHDAPKATFIDELEAAQNKSFDDLKTKLATYVVFNQVDEKVSDIEFKINKANSKIEHEKLILEIQIYKKTEKDKVIETKSITIKFAHHHH